MSSSPANAVVWTEIPVRDLEKATAFYAKLLGCDLIPQTSGPHQMANFPSAPNGVAGHLHVGTPPADGTGPTIHLAIPDTVEEAAARCFDAGGSVKGDIITIPPGRFQYAQDPDGNTIGLFESAKG